MELRVMEETTIRLKQDLSNFKAEQEQLKAQTKEQEGKPISSLVYCISSKNSVPLIFGHPWTKSNE